MYNVGAIFMMSYPYATTSRTVVHVDVRREIWNGIPGEVVIKFFSVKSEKNDTDTMTKTLRSKLHTKHVVRCVGNE